MKKNNKIYFDEKFLDFEKKEYSKKSWFIAGHKCEFEKIFDFKTFQIFGEPIVIYNFEKGIKAFSNVCLHRGSIIKNKKSGNEKFNCPYHFWSYDEDGKVKNIPLKNLCFENEKSISKLSLKKWKIDLCGNFIFITSAKNKTKLKSFLGKDFNKLKNISFKIRKKINSSSWVWNSNWKLCVENSIDEYHAIFVHQTTFKHILNQKPKYQYSKNVMSMEMPLRENYVKKFKKFSKNFGDKYNHILIFPLSTIASTMEHSFYLQRYTPLAINKTLITSDIYLANFSEKVSSSTLDFFSSMSKKFNDTVFEEDKIICENNHLGIKALSSEAIIGNYEERIKHFRKKILEIKR